MRIIDQTEPDSSQRGIELADIDRLTHATKLLPLPKGEGRGEGEARTVVNRHAAFWLARTVSFLLLLFTLSLPALCADLVKISGTVVDKNGKPIADATVDYYQFPSGGMVMDVPPPESKQHTTTDSAGAFSLSVPVGVANVVATKSGFAPAWKTLQSTPKAPLDPLVLTTPTVLAGVVVDENDHPLANAEVTVSTAVDKRDPSLGVMPNYLFGKAARDLFLARTSSDGRFRFENFPPQAQANLLATIPGRAMRTDKMAEYGQMQAQAGQQDIKLVTDPAGGIEGKLVLRDSGAPIAGAILQLQSSSPWGGASISDEPARTGADGSFRIADLSVGAYTITAHATNQPVPAWVTESTPVTVTAGKTTRNILLQAIKGGVVQVTVVGKDDQKPLPEVNVAAYGENYQASALTGSNGVALLRMPPGQFSLNAFKQGLSGPIQVQGQTTVSDGQTNTEKLELPSPLKITGTLKDASGTPLADSSIAVIPNYGGEQSDIKSDNNGHYEINWQMPPWAAQQNQPFFLVARNAQRNLAALHEITESTKTLDLNLAPAMSVSIRVQDPKGNAITNASGYLMLQTETYGFPIIREAIQSDQQGRLQVQSLPLGAQYSFSVNAKGYGSANQQMDNPNPKADHYDFPPVTLNLADRKLAGRVLGTNGQPVAGVNVWMNGEGQPNGNAITDSDGRFKFDAVCAGPINVSANAQGFNGNAQTMGGDTNLVIRFNDNNNNRFYSQENSRTASGTVYDASGRPAAGATVTVVPGWGMPGRTKSDENGEYKVNWQDQYGPRNAKYYVLARDPEHNLAGMELLSTNSEHISVHMESGLSISGTVLDANGTPLPHASVYLSINFPNVGGGMLEQRPAKISSDGTFTIPALPPDQQYNLFISAKDFGSVRKNITKAQSRTNSIEFPPFKLRAADREIAGQVLDTDGKPLPGAMVFIGGNNQPNGNMRSDGNGHFKFKVCSGPITVNANRPNGGGQNSWGATQARGGDMNVVVKLGQRPGGQGRTFARAEPLKPRPWSLAALITWPSGHKTAVITLASLQTGLLLAAAGFVLWTTSRKRT